MKKLSQAGRLYLRDYYILTEAQKDVYSFFNMVQDHIYQNLLDRIEDVPVVDGFTWKMWTSKSSPGYLSVWPESSTERTLFRKGKGELELVCRDIRHDNQMLSTDSLSLAVISKNTIRGKLKLVKQGVLTSAVKAATENGITLSFTKRTNFYHPVQVNLDDAVESAEILTETIIAYCIGINNFVAELVKGD